MKRFVLIVLILCLLAGCAAPAAETTPTTAATEPEPTQCSHDWQDGVCRLCAEICVHDWAMGACQSCAMECSHPSHDSVTQGCTVCGGFLPHEFMDGSCAWCSLKRIYAEKDLPESYDSPCAHPGTVEKLTYQTYAYGVAQLNDVPFTEIPAEKYAYVYLPHGYDPEKAYNVLYLMHGTNGTPETWFGLEDSKTGKAFRNTCNMVDALIEAGEIQPLIIVTPTYYTFVPRPSPYAWASTVAQLDSPACSGFGLELPQLVEAVETKYATFAYGNTARQSLRASRDHRAFAGYSQGAVITIRSALAQHLDIFGYLGNFSGFWTSFPSVAWALTEQFPEEEIRFWYHGEGSQDIAYSDHMEGYRQLVRQFPDRFTPGENILMVDKQGFGHDARNWSVDLYNVLHLFFL